MTSQDSAHQTSLVYLHVPPNSGAISKHDTEKLTVYAMALYAYQLCRNASLSFILTTFKVPLQVPTQKRSQPSLD